MSNQWDTDADAPSKIDKYEWRLPENGEQHQAQTVAPGDLLIKPGDMTLIPTMPPTRTGIQHGWIDWNVVSFTDDGTWYSTGSVEQEL